MYKNILILGSNGMMGNTIYKYLSTKKKINVFFGVRKIKIKKNNEKMFIGNIIYYKNLIKLKKFIINKNIQLIINCIGITKHKSLSRQKKLSVLLNQDINKIILSWGLNKKLLILSTDCVFNGKKGNYKENDKPNALDIYGKSKFLGEIRNSDKVITLRSSGIGHEINSKNGLLEWFIKNKSKNIKGFKKAYFTGPTTLELAKIIYKYIVNKLIKSGLYHIGAKKISKHDLLKIIKKIYHKNIEIIPDNKFIIDRSLNSNKFKRINNYMSPNWLNLIKQTKKFNEKF